MKRLIITQENLSINLSNQVKRKKVIKRLFLIYFVDFGFILSIFFIVKPEFWTKITNPEIILLSSFGFLTFIAIFYSLVFSDSSRIKLNEFKDAIDKEKKEIENQFETDKNSTSDSKKLKKLISTRDSNLTDLKQLNFLVQIDKILYLCVLTLIIAIEFYIANNLMISSILLAFGMICIFHIITTWAFVFQEEFIP